MLKLLAFAAVASVISVTLTIYLWDMWMDIKTFRLSIKSGDEKRVAFAFLLYAVTKTIVYFAALFLLPTILKKFYN